MDPDQSEVLDAGQVEDLYGIDGGEVLTRIVGMYLSKTPQRIEQLRIHLAAGNFAGIAGEAHKLKGASGSIGASRVAEICRRIESDAAAQDARSIEERVRALEAEFGRASEALQTVLKTGKPAAGQ